jgi:hypothetical protein
MIIYNEKVLICNAVTGNDWFRVRIYGYPDNGYLKYNLKHSRSITIYKAEVNFLIKLIKLLNIFCFKYLFAILNYKLIENSNG